MDYHLRTATFAYYRGPHLTAHRDCRTLPAHPPGGGDIVAALAILRKDISLAERIWQRWIIPLHQRSQQWLQAYRERRAQRRQPKL